MQVSVESGEGLERRLLVDLPAARVAAVMDRKLQDLARHVRLDGFRPGKVPMRTIRQRFGEQVRQETFGALIEETLYEAAGQQQLTPAGQPQIELRDAAEQGGLGYTAVFEVMPDVAVGDLAAQAIVRPIAEVVESDIDEMIEKLRKQRTEWVDVQRGAGDGDTVHINFRGVIDGETFDGGSAENVPLVLGSGAMIEGFESGLLGAAAGDQRTLDLRFPDDYRATHLAGKEVSFEVTVVRVAEPRVPEVNEDFVKAFGVESGDVEGLRADVGKNMRHELKQRLRALTKDRVMDALLAASPLDIPKALIEQESERMKQQMLDEMRQQGQRSSVDLPSSVFADQARRRVHLGLLVADIIAVHKIAVDEAQLRETIADFAESYENPQEMVDYYLQEPNARRSVENLVLENGVVEWILTQVQVTEASHGFAEIMENKV